jgi:hypothetical protein
LDGADTEPPSDPNKEEKTMSIQDCALDSQLSPQLLELLRDWGRAARPPIWLFPGQNDQSDHPPSTQSGRHRRPGSDVAFARRARFTDDVAGRNFSPSTPAGIRANAAKALFSRRWLLIGLNCF